MQVEQIDREAAEEWKWVLYDREDYDPEKEMEKNVAELAADFDRHRQASDAAGYAHAVEEIAVWVKGWNCSDCEGVGQIIAEQIEAKFGGSNES